MAIASLAVGTILRHPSVNSVVTTPGSYGNWPAWAGEFAISFILMTTVLLLNRFPRLLTRTGYVAGLLVAVYITFEAPLSGMSTNPARTLASALWGNIWTGLWIYFTAPVFGMLSAIELQRLWSAGHHTLCGKLTHSTNVECHIQCDCHATPGIQSSDSTS
jgi:aquaporin Z